MNSGRCTWAERSTAELVGSNYVRCENTAGCPQFDQRGAIWANLCAGHANALDNAVESGNVKRIASVWVKAHGGAAKLLETF